MEELLTQSGLTPAQAAAYLYLLDHGAAAPPAVAKALQLTRSNAYKVLDSLQELGLVSRQEIKKKFVYVPADPTALASLVAEKRNQVIALEHNVKTVMGQLRAKYRKNTGNNGVDVASGADALEATYLQQAETLQDIYFIKSRADIPFLGYETMNRLRRLPATNGVARYGITPAVAEMPSPAADAQTNLVRTTIDAAAYTAPVEWSVSGDELAILKFDGEGQSIRIHDPEIAASFRQIWQLAADSNNAS